MLEGGSDNEGSSTEAHKRAIIEVLGRDKRNEVLATLYMVRTDVSLLVHQAVLHVWKTILANTPKTLKEIMPVLMNTLITSLVTSSSERRQVAGRSLGELVRKLGERLLPLIIPILFQGLKDPNPSHRQHARGSRVHRLSVQLSSTMQAPTRTSCGDIQVGMKINYSTSMPGQKVQAHYNVIHPMSLNPNGSSW